MNLSLNICLGIVFGVVIFGLALECLRLGLGLRPGRSGSSTS